MRQCTRVAALAALSFILASCVEVLPPTATLPYQQGTSPAQISSAAVLLLQDYGFAVAVVEPSVGLIVSDWRSAKTASEEAFSAILTTLAYSPLHPSYGDRYQQRIRLTITTDQGARMVVIRPDKQAYSRINDWTAMNLDEGDKDMVKKFAADLAHKIGLVPSRVCWSDPLETSR